MSKISKPKRYPCVVLDAPEGYVIDPAPFPVPTKRRPVYDDVGNLIGYSRPHYHDLEGFPPSEIDTDVPVDLSDPVNYANVMTANENVTVETSVAVDAMQAHDTISQVLSNS